MKNQLIFILFSTITSGSLFAQTTPDTKAENATVKALVPTTLQTQKVEDFAGAVNLARYGYANNCALCLITAADMIYKLGVTPLPADAKTNPATTASETTKPEKPNPADPAKILADARLMAKGDATLLGLADRVKPQPGTRGAVGGPKSTTTRVEANSVDTFTIRFYGQSSAVVALRGDGDTDLDLYVYDENGNSIASDDDNSDYCIVRWTPRYTGLFTIRVRNRGNLYNRYSMATN